MILGMLTKIPNSRARNNVLLASGIGSLLVGKKVAAVTLFGSGLAGFEQIWRENHPDFEGGFKERLEESLKFYEETHSDEINRKLHVVGIPIILAGTIGLLVFRPPSPLWLGSLGAFTGGWVLNFIGHGVFEKGAPAFADDPLAFLTGPVWDFMNLTGRNGDSDVVDVDIEVEATA